MKLNKKELESRIKANKLKGIFLYGADVFIDFYSDFFITKIRQSAKEGNGELNVSNYFFETLNISELSHDLRSGSLFGDVKLLNIKIDKKLSKNDALNLTSACLKSENYLILSYYNNNDRLYNKNALTICSAFEKDNLAHVRFFEPFLNESMQILAQKSQDLGLNITQNTLFELLELQNFNLQMALNELKKYTIFQGQITSDLIKSTSSNLSLTNISSLIEALFTNLDIAQISLKLLSEGASPNDLCPNLERYFYNLFLIFTHAKMHGKIDKLSDILGFNPPPNIAKIYIERALKLKERHFEDIFFILCELKIESRFADNAHTLRAFLNKMLKLKRKINV
ncbi:MAG: hypothetical protein E7K04_01085 [Helicobacter sp.]|nr:hypothetical protein [Helicobacter sp.]